MLYKYINKLSRPQQACVVLLRNYDLNKQKHPRRAVIFANGPVDDYESLTTQLSPRDTIVCVDGGLKHIDALALIPDIIIGDMDSISHQRLAELGDLIPRIQHPSEKDETDLELALQWASDSAYEKVLLAGISGGRLDHTLANIHLMAVGSWAFELCAWQPGQYLWIMNSGETLRLNNYVGLTVSLLPMTEKAEGIRTEGVKYMLHNETLEFGTTRGVSNLIESQNAIISLVTGRLLVVLTYSDIGFP